MGVTASNNSWGGGDDSQALLDAIAEADARELAVRRRRRQRRVRQRRAPVLSRRATTCPNMIAVAATDQRDELAGFSNYGRSSVDLAAPGVNVYSTGPGRPATTGTTAPRWRRRTSTGVVALAKAAHPGASALGLKGLVLGGVDPQPSLAGLREERGCA